MSNSPPFLKVKDKDGTFLIKRSMFPADVLEQIDNSVDKTLHLSVPREVLREKLANTGMCEAQDILVNMPPNRNKKKEENEKPKYDYETLLAQGDELLRSAGRKLISLDVKTFPPPEEVTGVKVSGDIIVKNIIRFVANLAKKLDNPGSPTMFSKSLIVLLRTMTGVDSTTLYKFAKAEPEYQEYANLKRKSAYPNEECETKRRRTEDDHTLVVIPPPGSSPTLESIRNHRVRVGDIINFPMAIFTWDEFLACFPPSSSTDTSVFQYALKIWRDLGLIHVLVPKDRNINKCVFVKETRPAHLNRLCVLGLNKFEYLEVLYNGQKKTLLEQLAGFDVSLFETLFCDDCSKSIKQNIEHIFSMGVLQTQTPCPRIDIRSIELPVLQQVDVLRNKNILLPCGLSSSNEVMVRNPVVEEYAKYLNEYGIRNQSTLCQIHLRNRRDENEEGTSSMSQEKECEFDVKKEENQDEEGEYSSVEAHNFQDVWNDNLEMKIQKLEEEETEVDIKPDNLAVQ